jgi:small subunit ribosomal protein S16
MATKIRLARGGAKKRPVYRIVVADSRAPRDGRFIEKIGTYNPLAAKGSKDRVVLKKDRVEHWLKTGAEPTERVALFFKDAGLGKDNVAIKTIVKKRENSSKIAAEKAAKKAAEEAAKKAAEEAAAKAEADAAAAAAAEAAPAA